MLSSAVKCSVFLILFLRTLRASPVTMSTSKGRHLEHPTVRRAKFDEMLKYMNVSMDPCEDFYEFTCGNYGKYNTANDSSLAYANFFEKLDSLTSTKIEAVLNTNDTTDSDIDKQVKNFYRSCLSVRELKSVYRDQLKVALAEFGPMPLLAGDQWQEDDFDVLETTANMIHKTGLKILFEVDILADFHDKSIHRVRLAQAFLNRDLYVNELFADSREYMMNDIAKGLHKVLGMKGKLAKQSAQEILNFTIALAAGMVDEKLGLKNDEIYTLVSVDDLQQQYLPIGDFKKFLSVAVGFVPQKVYVNVPYVKNAMNLLAKTPKRVVANYIFNTYLESFIVDESIENTFCSSTAQKYFYRNLDNMIYRKYYARHGKEGISFMWQELKATFQNTLQSTRLNWMQEDTRTYALDKLKSMKLLINTYEDYDFNTEFAQLNLSDRDYVRNIVSILSMQGHRIRAKINEPPRPEEIGDAGSYSALNFCEGNEVQVPVNYLEPHYVWSSSYPQSYNFATLGSIIGHEIIHGFDNIGRHYDIQGNLMDWWDTRSSHVFRERTKCFRDQYKAYSFGGRPLPEMASQSENIADNGGVRLAYEAYRQWHQKSLSDRLDAGSKSMTDFGYTNKQLFFISYGQVWCAHIPADNMAKVAAIDIHVPEKLRVIGSLSNLEEFSQDFNCPLGSNMNPVKKCEIY